MPAALERKLKRQVAGKKMSKERKDAYVYGTLRKTGWKPEREKKLAALLDGLIQFAAVPSYWARGALKTGGNIVKGNTARIPVLGNAGKKVPFRLSQLGSTAKEPAWWNKSTAPRYYPGPSQSSIFSSSDKPIHLDETLLEPWQSNRFEGKLYQEQFPAGLSPLAALRLPFPQLMSYLNRRNILQQVFSEKLGKLIELNEKLDEIQHPKPQSATR